MTATDTEIVRQIHLVGGDDQSRQSLCTLLEPAAVPVSSFPAPTVYLREAVPAHPACILMDMQRTDIDGLDFLEQLCSSTDWIPVIFIATPELDVATAVSIMRAGAWHVLQRPLDGQALRTHVTEALDLAFKTSAQLASRSTVAARLALLSKREREILHSLVDGHSNREVAELLGTSHFTVDKQRASIMRKMQARTVAELVLMYSTVAPEAQFPRTPAMCWWRSQRGTLSQVH